jgi:hypothetical protein
LIHEVEVKQISFFLTGFFSLLFGAVSVYGQSSNDGEHFPEPKIPFAPKQYVCYRTDYPLDIDGKLNETAWLQAAWTDDFVDIEGDLKPQPRLRTRAKMLWNGRFFYIAGELEEPEVWAKLKKRDAVIFYDNDFEVFIDPDGDTHRYYELEVNAFSTEWDLFLVKPYRDGGPALNAWDIQGLKTAVAVDGTINKPGDRDKGWTIEIAIPWEVLKEVAPAGAPPQPGAQWRVNFSRVEWQTQVENGDYVKVKDPNTGKPLPEDNWVWSPQGVINMHYPETWGFVQFSGKVAGQGVELSEYQPEENVKWALRQIYYRERTHFNRYGKFTEDFELLGVKSNNVSGYSWPPEIKCTWNLFEARLMSRDSSTSLHIDQEGRVWKSTKP